MRQGDARHDFRDAHGEHYEPRPCRDLDHAVFIERTSPAPFEELASAALRALSVTSPNTEHAYDPRVGSDARAPARQGLAQATSLGRPIAAAMGAMLVQHHHGRTRDRPNEGSASLSRMHAFTAHGSRYRAE